MKKSFRRALTFLTAAALSLTAMIAAGGTAFADAEYSTWQERTEQNIRMMAETESFVQKKYLNTSLSDMYETDRKGMSEAEQTEIKAFADSLLSANGSPESDVEKLKIFHDWIRDTFYYYRTPSELTIVTRFGEMADNPATLLHMYRDYDGKVVSRCNGYTAMFIALARAEGIPARAVDGYYNQETRHNADSAVEWSADGSGTADHHWAAAFADGRWITVDCNADCYNQYLSGGVYWKQSASGFSEPEKDNYFDPSMERLAQSHIIYEFRPDPKLNAPGMLSPSTVTSTGKIKIRWKEAYGALTYKVYRATSKNGTYTMKKETEDLSWIDTTAKTGKTYYYKVKACNGDFASPYGTRISKICKLPRTTAKVSTATKGRLKVSWSKISGANKYYVYRATSKTGTYKKVKTATTLSYSDTNVKKGKKYYYKVKAVYSSNVNANSEFSKIVYGTVR